MTRRSQSDPDQANLFGWPPPQATPPRPRAGKLAAEPASAPSEPEDIESFAARASSADLDALVLALPDAALAHVALASARQLRRRLSRIVATHRGKGRARPNVLERAGQNLAREWAAPMEADDAW